MNKLLFTGLLAYAVLLASVYSSPSTGTLVENGYIPGRSGDIVLSYDGSSASTITVCDNANGRYLNKAVGNNILLDTDVANIFTRSLALNPIGNKHSQRSASRVVRSDVFNPPLANLLLTLEGVDHATVSRYNLLSVLSDGLTFPLAPASFPQDTVSTLANALTGQTPSVHGISEDDAWSNVANVLDVLEQTTKGQSSIVSFAFSRDVARVTAPHQTLLQGHPEWKTSVVFFDTQSQRFSSSIEMVGSPVTLERTVTVRDVAVTFDAGVQEHDQLINELQELLNIVQAIQEHRAVQLYSLSQDDSPDFYAFTLTALQGIRGKYGAESIEYQAALKLVDSVLTKVYSALSSLYPNRLMCEVLLLPASNEPLDRVKQLVFTATKPFLADQTSFDARYPSIYLRKDLSVNEVLQICAALEDQLSGDRINVHCLAAAKDNLPSAMFLSNPMVQLEVGSLAASNGTVVNVMKYQITLWLSLLLILILLGAVCMLLCCVNADYDTLENKRDTLLYGRFNPGMDSKKHL